MGNAKLQNVVTLITLFAFIAVVLLFIGGMFLLFVDMDASKIAFVLSFALLAAHPPIITMVLGDSYLRLRKLSAANVEGWTLSASIVLGYLVYLQP